MATGAALGYKWLYNAPTEGKTITGGARVPLRRALNKTELAMRRLFYSEKHLVKTYPKSMAAKIVRQNSDVGLESGIDLPTWKLEICKSNGQQLLISIDAIKALPKTEIVFDFKCVEGWDQIQYWGGLRFVDFVKHFNLDREAKLQYVGMETPDKKYFVGLDMDSAMHPQTILAYEMNGKPIPVNHGAPLRLIIPVKYGVKNLKRIGSITFASSRPRDYWAEKGYDYYLGL
ncbi:molybdopterin-dependent oxidoreductase [Mucilaginibacter antarcticus]|uniref:molybdopterin-dependent oxidoreductase n=1 Tax=Mucilaginibacter antarcticus TaxID=1855725 RepID=UPI00362BD05D